MTSPILAKLANLSSQRTARTDRLHAAVGTLLTTLEDHVRVGDSVTVDGCTLARVVTRSNVGQREQWRFSRPDDSGDYGTVSCDPERPVGGEGYLHGDFHAGWRGPSRQDLLALASRADRFVDALTANLESEAAAVEAAVMRADAAAERAAEIGGAA